MDNFLKSPDTQAILGQIKWWDGESVRELFPLAENYARTLIAASDEYMINVPIPKPRVKPTLFFPPLKTEEKKPDRHIEAEWRDFMLAGWGIFKKITITVSPKDLWPRGSFPTLNNTPDCIAFDPKRWAIFVNFHSGLPRLQEIKIRTLNFDELENL